MATNKESVNGIIEKLALISDGLIDILPNAKVVVVYSLKNEEFSFMKAQVNDFSSNEQFKMDVGVYNALEGKSYGEIGGEARSMHKSQGEGRPRRKGEIIEYFTTIVGEAPTRNLLDGVTLDWTRLGENAASISSAIDAAIIILSMSSSVIPASLSVFISLATFINSRRCLIVKGLTILVFPSEKVISVPLN
jgi:hypothetical protein